MCLDPDAGFSGQMPILKLTCKADGSFCPIRGPHSATIRELPYLVAGVRFSIIVDWHLSFGSSIG